MSRSFWPERRVVVTGGAGFLGSFVCEGLRERGCSEVLIPRHSEYDLTSLADIERMYSEMRPDLVIHLAADVGGIGANRENPGTYFYNNLMMGVQLIEAGRRAGLEKFVAIGTVCAYPKHTPVPFSEDDLWNGYPEETNAPYGLAKKMMLVQAQAYRQQYDFNCIYLLPVNLYGPQDDFNLHSSHVIPALIRKCLEASDEGRDTLELWGTGQASREFLYVEDAARAILEASERYDEADPVNLGSGKEITIEKLAWQIARLAGFEGTLRFDTDMPDGQPRRCLDTSRARERFGFAAEVDQEDGLRRTIEWYRAHRHTSPDGGPQGDSQPGTTQRLHEGLERE